MYSDMKEINLKQVKRFASNNSAPYRVKIEWVDEKLVDEGAIGQYHENAKLLRIATDWPAEVVLSIYFHEIQHHLNHLQGRDYRPRFGVDLAEELYTDMLACISMNEYFPNLTYHFGYTPKTVKKHLALENKCRERQPEPMYYKWWFIADKRIKKLERNTDKLLFLYKLHSDEQIFQELKAGIHRQITRKHNGAYHMKKVGTYIPKDAWVPENTKEVN